MIWKESDVALPNATSSSRPWTKVAVEIVWVQVNSLNDTLLDFVYLSFFWRGGRGSWNLV